MSAPSHFAARLAPARPTPAQAREKRWVYVPYDQLGEHAGPLAEASPREVGAVFVESAEKARRRPYHKKKLALLLANERHFALELAARGYSVLYLAGDAPIAAQLREAQRRYELGPLAHARPAERELREELAAEPSLARDERPHRGWLTTPEQFLAWCPRAPYRMDAFYRAARRALRVLLTPQGKPLGGRFSFDGENRARWPGEPAPPPRFACEPDAVTREVCALVERHFAHAWGDLAGFDLPTTALDAQRAWQHALRYALPHFGPYEDAMARAAPRLFHTGVAPLVNLGRLAPAALVRDVEEAHRAGRVPLASAEGFVRQVLGWREFVRHVHERTEGFRSLREVPGAPEGAPSLLGAREPLPPAYWGAKPSGLACLDGVVDDVWRDGYSHHITRLMVLANVGTLLGVAPRALTDWFWAAYTDAYDWVVEPNVLAMGTYGAGPVMTTKPYVSGAAYLHKMGDACGACRFDPTGRDGARPCPLTPMYWAFLARSRGALEGNERMKLPLAAEARRSPAQRAHASAVTERVRAHLARGERLPSDVARER